MIEFKTYEESAMAIQHVYEDDLDATDTNNELARMAINCIETEMPDASEEAVAHITNKIVILYEGTDG